MALIQALMRRNITSNKMLYPVLLDALPFLSQDSFMVFEVFISGKTFPDTIHKLIP